MYNVKNTINNDKKAAKLSDEGKETCEAEIKQAQEWLEENPKASKDEFDETQKAVQKVVGPIFSRVLLCVKNCTLNSASSPLVLCPSAAKNASCNKIWCGWVETERLSLAIDRLLCQ